MNQGAKFSLKTQNKLPAKESVSMFDGLIKQFDNLKLSDVLQPKIKAPAVYKNLLKIGKAEWANATDYFSRNVNATKLSKKASNDKSHAFIKMQDKNGADVICAVANPHNKKEVKFGNLSKNKSEKIKVGQLPNGDNVAIKIEIQEKPALEKQNILKLADFFEGAMSRDVVINHAKVKKLYTAMPYLPGDTMEKYCLNANESINAQDGKYQLDMHLIALQACVATHNLHSKGIIHGNIKGDSFIIDWRRQSDKIVVKPTNFGLSTLLEQNKETIYAPFKESIYMSPEILIEAERSMSKNVHYSIYSDIYALGRMFKSELKIGKDIYQDMLFGSSFEDAKDRTPLPVVMGKLLRKIFSPQNNRFLSQETKISLLQLEQELSLNEKTALYTKQLKYNAEQIRLLNVPEEEWIEAEWFFKNNPTQEKYSKKTLQKHSFIKLKNQEGNDEIYALANRHLQYEQQLANVGKGGFGKVKVMQNRQGECKAVKILNFGLNQDGIPERMQSLENEVEMLTKLNAFNGSLLRKVTYPWFKEGERYKGLQSLKALKVGTIKGYVAQSLVPGKNVKNLLMFKSLSPLAKYKTALQIALCVKELHKMGIIHGDIKGENYVVDHDSDNDTVSVLPVDFGIAVKFDPTSDTIFWGAETAGTGPYMAKELALIENDKSPFSIYSDIYALGKTFELDLKLEPEIYENMISGETLEGATLRTPLDKTINLLIFKIENLLANDQAQQNIDWQRVKPDPIIFSNFATDKIKYGERKNHTKFAASDAPEQLSHQFAANDELSQKRKFATKTF